MARVTLTSTMDDGARPTLPTSLGKYHADAAAYIVLAHQGGLLFIYALHNAALHHWQGNLENFYHFQKAH